MPHSTQNQIKKDEQFCMEKLLDKSAHLLREQELFLRELENFKARLLRFESKFVSKKRNRK
jgi:hypothetical protein